MNTYSVSKGNDSLTEAEKLEYVKKYNLQELLHLLRMFESNDMEFNDVIIVLLTAQKS